MPWNETLTALDHVLARLYPTVEDSYRIVAAAGIPPEFVAFQRRAIDNWFQILIEANNRNKVLDVVRLVLEQYPDDPILIQAQKGDLIRLKGPEIKDKNWKATLPDDAIEKIMGQQSTFLPLSFLEVGLLRARAVARVVLKSGKGSGFLTQNNILVTNNHVIENEQEAREAIVQFNYQQNMRGLDLEPVDFRLEPDHGFKTSTEDDWTLVRIKGDANADWGMIELKPVDIKNLDTVNIIQHPGGGPKQIALYHNFVTYRDDKRLQYLTDTLPGSSGSPVFDSQWNPVALHHSGGWMLEPGTKNQVYRNEGININVVIDGLTKSGLRSQPAKGKQQPLKKAVKTATKAKRRI